MSKANWRSFIDWCLIKSGAQTQQPRTPNNKRIAHKSNVNVGFYYGGEEYLAHHVGEIYFWRKGTRNSLR